MLWDERTWVEIDAFPPFVALFPVGAIEQHGPHLPLSTDLVIPQRIAAAVAERTGLALLPALPFGARSRGRTGGGERFSGGLFAEPETLIGLVEGIVADALGAGVRTVFVLSWHYENAPLLWEACRRAQRRAGEGTRVFLVDSPGDLMPAELVGDDYPGEFPGWAAEHAAVVETSLMLHLAPELVRGEAIPDGAPPPAEPWQAFPEDLQTLPDSGAFAPADRSTAAYGARLFEAICDGLVALIESQGRGDG